MHYFPDVIAFLCVFPSGLIYGFYFKSFWIGQTEIFAHWYALVGVLCAISVSAILTVKKVRQKKYTFDHFYVILYGIVCFLISACFLLNKAIVPGLYFGFAGNGIVHVPIYTYISQRSSTVGYRPARVALANAIYFSGLAIGFSLFLEFNTTTGLLLGYNFNGWLLLGSGIICLIGIVVNEILQLTNAVNYKKSRDLDWNTANNNETLFFSEKLIRQKCQHGEWSQFVLGKSRQTVTVILIFITIIERVMFFGFSILAVSLLSSHMALDNPNLHMSFILYALGTILGAVLLIWFHGKHIQLILALIKIAATIAFLTVHSVQQFDKLFVFFCFYFIAMATYSSIPLQGLLESAPFKYTEIIFGMAYAFEIIIIEAFKYETKTFDDGFPIFTNILAMGITFTMLSLVFVIIVQMYFPPKSEGLLNMRNKLIGLNKANFIPRARVWNTQWMFNRNSPSSNVTNIKLDGNRLFQQYPAVK